MQFKRDTVYVLYQIITIIQDSTDDEGETNDGKINDRATDLVQSDGRINNKPWRFNWWGEKKDKEKFKVETLVRQKRSRKGETGKEVNKKTQNYACRERPRGIFPRNGS